ALFNLALMRLGVEARHHAMPGGSATVLVQKLRGFGRVGVVRRGPVWGASARRMRSEGLAGLRAALGLSHLLVTPDAARDDPILARAGFVRVAPPLSVALLSLDGGPDAWLARMSPQARTALSAAKRGGVVVERHDILPDGDHWLFAEEGGGQRMTTVRSLPHPILAEIARGAPGAVQVFLARRDTEALAAMLFLRHGHMASFQMGWMTEAGRDIGATTLLAWETMHAMALCGHGLLDLGPISGRRAGAVDAWKLSTGASVHRLGATWLDSAWVAPLHALRRWRARRAD
ncbi:MAG: GNAT family N-acetyltransferase, partial [Pseudomonadota bacterium]